MDFERVFSLVSTVALVGWLALIGLPRWPRLIALLRTGLIGALSLTYAVLIFVYFFRVEGGGFGSLSAVRTLFMNDAVLTAGWIHYLAFDLFVGIWIAVEADRLDLHRLLQAPILLATFMFGPLGLLLFLITRAIRLALSPAKA